MLIQLCVPSFLPYPRHVKNSNIEDKSFSDQQQQLDTLAIVGWPTNRELQSKFLVAKIVGLVLEIENLTFDLLVNVQGG